jgi:hypothetical protein
MELIEIMYGESINMVNVLEEILRNKPICDDRDTIHAIIARDGTILAVWTEPPNRFHIQTPDTKILKLLTENFLTLLTTPPADMASFAFQISEIKIRQAVNVMGEIIKTSPWRQVNVKAALGRNAFVFDIVDKEPKPVKRYLHHFVKVACAFLVAMIVPHILVFSQWAPPAKVQPNTEPITVYIKGYVHKPGVYQIKENSLALDAVHAAGGFSLGADPNQLNLTQPISDCQEILVPGTLPKLP